VPLPSDFNPEVYLDLNPDVKCAGVDPRNHYLEFGASESRVYRHLAGLPTSEDFKLHSNPQTQRPKYIDHEGIWKWIGENFNVSGLKVLEIGSRAVSSNSLWRKVIPRVDYVGFDIQPGINVDVIGDIHFLSDYFQRETFDLIISFAVFEHVALPWVAAEEITKVLKPGGSIALETHFSFSEHELPWHFFQFNSRGLEVLFSKELGYETIDLGMSSPIVGRFSQEAAPYLRGNLVRDLYCHSAIAAKKVSKVDLPIDWRKIATRLSTDSEYPMESAITE
jgi:SAM-dependent methyltransferase